MGLLKDEKIDIVSILEPHQENVLLCMQGRLVANLQQIPSCSKDTLYYRCSALMVTWTRLCGV